MRVNPITPVIPTNPTHNRRKPMKDHNPTYPSTTLVKNITPLGRTLSEVNRDARYAIAIQTFKSDAKLAGNFFIEAVIGFVVTLAMLAPFAVGFWLWLNK